MTKTKDANQRAGEPIDYERAYRELNKVVARLTKGENGEPSKQRYFDEMWLATRWHVSDKLIQKMRYDGTGPRVTRFGTAVRYRLKDIQAFEEANLDIRPSGDETSHSGPSDPTD